jgi:hypothetical protein
MIEPASNLFHLIREVCVMGLFFPVYPPNELNNVEQHKRSELKAEILRVLQTDPDVRKLLEDKLPELRRLLKDKTRARFEDLRLK